MKQLEIQLETLSCPTCAAKIQAVLRKTKGVQNPEVLFNSSRVRLSLDTTIIDPEGVMKIISTLGYATISVRESSS